MSDKTFPDGNDRTPNDPCLLLTAASVKRIYESNCGRPEDGHRDYTWEDVKEFFTKKAKENNIYQWRNL